MKLSLPWRIGLVIALTGALAAGLAGYYSYRASRELLIAGAEDRLQTATRVLSRQLALALDAGARDVLVLARHPQAALLLSGAEASELRTRFERNTAALLQGIVRTHPEYLQLRLIDAQAHGLEHIRVDREGDTVRRIEGDELLEKGHQPYVYETLRLPAGAIYLSEVSLGRDGEPAGRPQPNLQMAAPIHDAQQRARGVVVVDIDLEKLFRQLAADLPPGLRLYLLNGRGDYLIHPDPARAFAFARGQRANVLDEHPQAKALFEAPGKRIDEQVSHSADGHVAAFARQPATEAKLDTTFIVGLSQPLAEVSVEGERLGLSVLRIGLAACLLAMLLAALLARALSRPLLQIVGAVQRVASGAPEEVVLPLGRGDEIGLLARAVRDMQQQIRSQFMRLQLKQDELDNLASRDSLTGLLNRRVFLDRLEHALAQVRRSHQPLALLFIDLDRFKAINDLHGHGAGDTVLQTLAQRLLALVREADSVARIGGDEFVILLDPAGPQLDATVVADKVREALTQPVPFGALQLRCGASIGIGRYPADGTTVGELLSAADRAMYEVKHASPQAAGLPQPTPAADPDLH
ncbi:MAG: GGDEF domain-containing protein [Inhella sp.]|nr:GGDEF domain-containing protein [Inhella sp.]